MTYRFDKKKLKSGMRSHRIKTLVSFILFFLLIHLSHASQDPDLKIKEAIPTIRIALPAEESSDSSSNDSFLKMVNFLKEYWQIWSIDNQRSIEFVYMPSNQIYLALENQQIDIAAVTTFDDTQKNMLYSIPYAKFKQSVFRQIIGNKRFGFQLGIHSNSINNLDFLESKIEVKYYKNIDNLLTDYKNFDALYSTQPWLLSQKLADLDLLKEFYKSTDDAPSVYFHFATHKNNRSLLYKLNNDLRNVNKEQANIWEKKYTESNEGTIELTLGSYFIELSEEEKQYIIDHTQLYYPITKNGFPPYVITNNDTNITVRGLAIDLIHIAQEKTGIIFRPYHVDNLALAMETISNTNTDFLIYAQNNEERAQRYQFSIPYLKVNYNLITRQNYELAFNTKDLSSNTIAVVVDFDTTEILKKQFPHATFITYASIEEAINSVSNGQTNAFVGRSLVSSYIIKQQRLSNLTSKPLPKFRDEAQLSFAALKDNKALITLLNKTINNIPANQFDSIYKKWSQSAFSERNVQDQVNIAYRQSGYALLIFVLIALIFFWIYYRHQRKIQIRRDSALSIAEKARVNAEKAAQAKITFLARMSHEIRTPMNGVLGMAEALAFTQLDKNQQELLETLETSAQNLLALLNDVLDFSKMDAGKLTLESVPVNFHLLAKNIMSSYRLLINAKDIKFDYYVEDKISHNYLTDPTRITQVLNNLISNAIKFTEQGAISLSISLLDTSTVNNSIHDTLLIRVKDTGIGIALKHQASLFTPFKQADDQITRKYGGTGLGLSICQEIAAAMGTTIKLRSTQNIGSEFYFTLTLIQSGIESDTEERRKNKRIINSPEDNRFTNLRILIAEDNLVNIKVLTAQLNRINVHPEIAQDGEQAFKMYMDNPYDIILSDCHMPIMDGFELAKKITQVKADKPVWLIAITADALPGSAENCFAAGFDDYMSKPCSQEVVTDKLNNAYRQLSKTKMKTK